MLYIHYSTSSKELTSGYRLFFQESQTKKTSVINLNRCFNIITHQISLLIH